MAFKKEYVVRWSEIDANMHLTSSAYIRYITDTRMSFFVDNGFALREMKKHKLGPIVLSEKSYFFKEIPPDEKITVTMANAGVSANGKMMRLAHRIYNSKKENCFLAFTLMAFFDVVERKMLIPPVELQDILDNLPKSDQFRILEKEELRDAEAVPR